MAIDYDPMQPGWHGDPYPVYRNLREHAPVHFAARSQVFSVSRYEDAVSVLKRPELFSSEAMRSVLTNTNMGPLRPRTIAALLRFLLRTRISPIRMSRADTLISLDPPRHEALRAIVNRGFTPRRIAAWEPRVRQIVREQMARLEHGKIFDVVRDLAIPLPTTIIAEMLGVEPARRADFKRWSDAVIAVSSGSARSKPPSSGLFEAFGELYVYLRGVVRHRRREPADDLIGSLVDPAQESVLVDELDVIQFVVLLLVAGNETTTNLIGNAVAALLAHPDQLERAAGDPSLVPDIVEEALRFDAPIQLVFRRTTCELELAGTRIPKGAVVAPLLGSANRDERRFERPDAFDLERDARGHLGFGLGMHFCLGASLARLEARVALEALVPELPRLKQVGEPPAWVDSFLVRGRTRLELAVF